MKRKNAGRMLLAVLGTTAVVLMGCSSNVPKDASAETVETAIEKTADETAVEEKASNEDKVETEANKESETEDKTAENTETKIEIETEVETMAQVNSDAPTAVEVLSQMGVGWNLGNTFDAWGASNPADNETFWGNPKTTKEMIDAVRAQGFDTIRIPVTWGEHLGKAPDYTIDSEWLDRVAEVVDYAYDEGMFVILDTHHEPDFWLKPQKDGLDGTKEELAAIWTQLAGRFAEYDYKLLFEGMNEPRIKGSPTEWSGGTDEGRAVVNELNKVFVDTVRATGGENVTRCLIICPYGNSVTTSTITQLKVPDDKYVMVAAHLYTPYVFTYQPDSGNVNEWTGELKKDITWAVGQLNTNLIKKGIPVIVTEMGAVNKTYTDENGSKVQNTEQVVKWLADYMEVMNQYGVKCVWWDNGIYNGDGEKFAIFDRKNCTWYSQEIADAIVKYAATPAQ